MAVSGVGEIHDLMVLDGLYEIFYGYHAAAATVLLMTADKAQELGLTPLVRIKAFASGGLDPAYMGLGPVPAVRKVLAATGMTRVYPFIDPSRSPPWMKKVSPANASLR